MNLDGEGRMRFDALTGRVAELKAELAEETAAHIETGEMLGKAMSESAAEHTSHAETRAALEEARDDERSAIVRWLQSQLSGLGRYGVPPTIVAICIDLAECKHREPRPKGIEGESLLVRTLAAESDSEGDAS